MVHFLERDLNSRAPVTLAVRWIDIRNLNPYEAATTSLSEDNSRVRATQLVRRLRAVFWFHLFFVVSGAFVIHSNTSLSDRYLGALIAFPLFLTIFACPLAITLLIALSRHRSSGTATFVLASDLIVSIVQYFQWLPTFQ